MKFTNFIVGPATESREFNGVTYCVTGYSMAWRKKMLDEKVREENDRIKEESFREINGKTYKRKDLSEKQKKMRLKAEYQKLADDFENAGCCSCHINPPCGHCTHPGNPIALENTEEAWEEDLDDGVESAPIKLKDFGCIFVDNFGYVLFR